MIEVEIQNETHQTQERIRFAAVPRIGEGIRLKEPDGVWASYDVIDVWYQKAEFGDIWTPYLHICMTPADTQEVAVEPAFEQQAIHLARQQPHEVHAHEAQGHEALAAQAQAAQAQAQEIQAGAVHAYEEEVHEDDGHDLHGEGAFASLAGEAEPFKI